MLTYTRFQTTTNLEGEIALKKTQKFRIILRIVILICICISLPLLWVYIDVFRRIEEIYFISRIDTGIYDDKLFIWFAKGIISIVNLKLVTVLNMLLYVFISPYFAIKISLLYNVIHFLYTICILIVQSPRPFWSFPSENVIYCDLAYGLPSYKFLVLSFYYIYIIFDYYKKWGRRDPLSRFKKVLLFGALCLVIVVIGWVNFITKMNYLHQLVITCSLSLVILVLIVELDIYIERFCIKYLGNSFRLRQFNMMVFALTLSLSMLVYLIFILNESFSYSNEILKFSKVESCKGNKVLYGTTSTFLMFATNFSLIGLLMGSTLNLDNCYWINSRNTSFCLRAIEISAIGLLSAVFLYPLNLNEKLNLKEFLYLMTCLEVWAYHFLFSWLLPKILNKLHRSFSLDGDQLDSYQSRGLIHSDLGESFSSENIN